MSDRSFSLRDFVEESNRIEGIRRSTDQFLRELAAYKRFLQLDRVSVPGLLDLLSVLQPNARLRSEPGLNVRVGDHFPPHGGPSIPVMLQELLNELQSQASPLSTDPWEAHCRYESLHPFTDGNGRTGRALWLWHQRRLGRKTALGFLHEFYYQTLGHYPGRISG